MKFRPLNDYVLVERIPSPTTSKGGIVLTTRGIEKSNLCKVLAVGEEEVYDDEQDAFVTMPTVDVVIGATVLIGKDKGQEIQWDDKDCVVLLGKEILAVIEDETCLCEQGKDNDCPTCAEPHSNLP